MTPRLANWAARVGTRIADDHRRLRKRRDAAKYLVAQLRKSGPLLGGVLRVEVEAAFWRRLAELEGGDRK